MTARVTAMRSAVNQYGMALGIRNRRSTSRSEAAYEAMSSSAAGSTLVRPRTELTIVGKKVISPTIVTRGSGLSNPNQLIMIGASAMIGTALIAVPNGTSVARAIIQREAANPARVPSVTPSASPPSASEAVYTTPFDRVGHSFCSDVQMALGRGIRNAGTFRIVNAISQNTSTPTKTTTGGARSSERARRIASAV